MRLEGNMVGFTKLLLHYLIFATCDLAIKINTRSFSSVFLIPCWI